VAEAKVSTLHDSQSGILPLKVYVPCWHSRREFLVHLPCHCRSGCVIRSVGAGAGGEGRRNQKSFTHWRHQGEVFFQPDRERQCHLCPIPDLIWRSFVFPSTRYSDGWHRASHSFNWPGLGLEDLQRIEGGRRTPEKAIVASS
jgi:hypothetical protein